MDVLKIVKNYLRKFEGNSKKLVKYLYDGFDSRF